MTKQREIRRLAMQVLYQLDLRGGNDLDWIRVGVAEGPDPADVQQQGIELATAAWSCHEEADAVVSRIAPQWPTHRQPAVDRAILRLAYYEMAACRTPPRVVMNEAIELAKKYCSEQGPAFINGVLDKIAAQLSSSATSPTPHFTSSPPEATLKPSGFPESPTVRLESPKEEHAGLMAASAMSVSTRGS